MDNFLEGARILVVDDEQSIRDILTAAFSAKGARVQVACDGEEGLEMVREHQLDLIISDVQMPRMDGLEFLAKVKEEQPWLEVLLITAHGSMDAVLKAMRLGAGDFLSKPFDIPHLRQVCCGLLARRGRSAQGAGALGEAGSCVSDGAEPVGCSPAFQQARDMALRAARSDSSVLITGESGTGKEVMARLVHRNSPRAKGAFVPVNCGAIPESLMESELFGYEKGAFTGALQEKPGKVEMAAGGTLFLDEIGEMPPALQVKLLRVLQERVVDRVGALTSRPVDFRLVAATNRTLSEEIAKGRFREDLYYRLNVIPVHLPPLRNRGDDLAALAKFFLERLNTRLGTDFHLAESHLRVLASYNWPGNIRELENILERSVVLSSSAELEVFLPTVPAGACAPAGVAAPLEDARQQAERQVLLDALQRCGQNKSQVARELGISRRSLLYKVKAYGI